MVLPVKNKKCELFYLHNNVGFYTLLFSFKVVMLWTNLNIICLAKTWVCNHGFDLCSQVEVSFIEWVDLCRNLISAVFALEGRENILAFIE